LLGNRQIDERFLHLILTLANCQVSPDRAHTFVKRYSVLYFTWKFNRKDVQTVSYMVARMQKMKADNLVGVGNHNQRKTKNHSNKDIDVERSHLNYDLVQGRTENYKTDIQDFINENKSTSRAVRKDAVLVNEWIISSDGAFFEDKDEKEIERFFEDTKEYFADKFGDKNIRYAQVHLDENTPHMHLGIVPFDKDKKLSAKRVFGRQALRDVQDDLPRFLNERGFAIQRGEKGSERKNLTVPEYKEMSSRLTDLKLDISDTEKEFNQRKQQVLALLEKKAEVSIEKLNMRYETKNVEVPTGKKNIFGKEEMKIEKKRTGNLIIPEDKFKSLKNIVDLTSTAQLRVNDYLKTDLVQENKKLQKNYNNLEEKHNQNVHDYNDLLEENKSLKQEIKGIYRGIASYFQKGSKTIEQAKTLVKGIVDEVKQFVQGGELERTHKQETRQERNRGGRSR